MTDFDKILLAVIGVGAIIGMWKGFFKEAVNTFGLVLAAIAANYIVPYGLPYVCHWFSSERAAGITTWLVLFLLAMIVLGWIAKLLDQLFDSASLGWAVRLGGAALGGIKVALLCAFFLSTIQMLSSVIPEINIQEYVESSRIVPLLHQVVGVIVPWVSEHILQPALEMLRQA